MARKKYTELEKKYMKEVSRNLRRILWERNISQKELSEKTGLATSTISDYINGKTLISMGNLEIISNALNVEKSEIDSYLKSETKIHTPSIIMIPIAGKISCGNGIIALEDIEGYEPTPKDWVNGGEYFYLRAKGDSMIDARIYDGDLLLIKKQQDVENGEIAAVMIGDEAILKKVYRDGNRIILQSANSNYEPIICSEEDITIIGKLKKNVINY